MQLLKKIVMDKLHLEGEKESIFRPYIESNVRTEKIYTQRQDRDPLGHFQEWEGGWKQGWTM